MMPGLKKRLQLQKIVVDFEIDGPSLKSGEAGPSGDAKLC